GEVVVDLEPGLAFGTGDHPTTRMALAALERTVHPGDRVLDFGTGSGVLACAAARLGAAAVLALDVDPQAVAAARRNVALNGLDGVTVAQADAPPTGGAPYDVAVANISAGVIVQVLPALLAAVRPGGRCLLGGIIAPQLARVTRALAGTTMGGQPLRPSEVHSDGEWRGLEVVRPAGLRG
ncbi:MAG: 50S ribosomal protein L11 methyltransferase, partial [Chloroflexota bacterium]|nr:50S ribosomal protein L11 methyltransferase [Chloroflexota bacterium]